MSDLREAWEGRAGQVRVGHFIQGSRRTLDDIWEIVEMKNPTQIEYGHTLWWRAANTTTGLEVAIPPKVVTQRIRFMLTREEREKAESAKKPPDLPHSWPVDSEEVFLLAEKLGASEIATRDNETGEITCPDYAGSFATARPGAIQVVEEIEHLRICHGLDTSGLEGLAGQERTLAVIKAHGDLHGTRSSKMAHRGFPHRHVPEDHSIL